MNTKSQKLISVLLCLAMLLTLVPATAFATGDRYIWEQNATMTLTKSESGESVEVSPATVYDGSDGIRKMKIYEIFGGEHYTLTTSENNDYAVLFKVNTVRKGNDEFSYYYPDASVTLDNVTIKTKNPIQSDVDTGGKYAAMMFYQMVENETDIRVRLDILLKGTNTIELLDVKDDVATNSWAAMSVIGLAGDTYYVDSAIRNVNETDAALNLKAELSAARGKVSALHTYSYCDLYTAPNFYLGYDNYEHNYSNIGYKPSGISGWGDEPTTPTEVIMSGKTTIDLYASATNADTGVKYGDGIYTDGGGFRLAFGVEGNIYAESHGVRNDAGLLMINNVNIRAGEVGIAAYNTTLDVIASTADQRGPKMLQATEPGRLEITGHKNADGTYAPVKQGIRAKSDIRFSGYGDIYIKAENEAIYAGDESNTLNTYIELFNKASVVVEGSLTSPDRYAIYLPNTRYNTLHVHQGAKLTVNAGYRAIHAKYHTYDYGTTTEITTTEPLEGGAMFVGYSATFSGDIDYGDAKFDANVASDYLVENGYLYFRGKDVFIHAKEAAIRDTVGIDRYSNTIPTYQCADGTSWEPFGQRCSKPYFTTRTPQTHICANDGYYAFQPIDGTEKHSADCLACGEAIEGDCDFEYSSSSNPTATTEGYHYYRCRICDRFKVVEIPAHDCTQYGTDWTDEVTVHSGKCTYTGCELDITAEHTFGEWVRIDHLTKKKTCTACGREETEGIHKNVTHIEAKSPTCASIGTREAWYCGDSDCRCYYSDSNLTQGATLAELTLPKTQHTFVDGKCTVCGETNAEATFVFESIDYYSSSMSGIRYILLAKANGKTYAMGKTVNADGSRAAVEVSVRPNGTIRAMPDSVEVFTFSYGDPTTFLADGGYMAVIDGKIVIYEKQYCLTEQNQPICYNNASKWDEDNNEYYYYKILTSEEKTTYKNSYIALDPTTLSFSVTENSEEAEVLMYREVCAHNGEGAMMHQPAVAPTCIEQGTQEYWYCRDCNKYYINGDLEAPVDTDEYAPYSLQEILTIPAIGHSYGADDICEHCDAERPIYTQVSTLEQLKAMPLDTSYIMVVKDGDKTYAAFLPPECPFDIDRNRNHIPDILETDLDENGVPNGIKGYDLGEDGIEDYLQDINGNGRVDMDDWRELCIYRLSQNYYESVNTLPNYVEVTVQPDGSIVLADEQAMEFYMYPSGPWGRLGDEFNGGGMRMMSLPGKEGGEMPGELPMNDNSEIDNCSKNWWAMFVPNYWVYHGGLMGTYGPEHFATVSRAYGDYRFPGVIDYHNWYIEFNADGTACMVTGYENGLSREAALKLATFTYGGVPVTAIVGISPTFPPDFTIDSSLPVYLYASVPVYNHTHTWSEWREYNQNSHARFCTRSGCTGIETEEHTWQHVVNNGNGTCSRACSVCGATYTDYHDMFFFGYTEATHTLECSYCGYRETDIHNGRCESLKNGYHTCHCYVCNSYNVKIQQKCNYDFIRRTETEMIYRCGKCGHEYRVDISVDKPVSSVDASGETSASLAGQNDNVVIPLGTVFNVVETEKDVDEELQGNIEDAIANNSTEPEDVGTVDVLAQYDMSLTHNDAVIQPGGDVLVTLSKPASEEDYDAYQVIYVSDSQYVDVHETTVNDEENTISFITNHFSKYLIVGYNRSGVTVSGTVTSFDSATENVTIELWKEGETTATKTTTVSGNSATYSIEGVSTGTYTLKVMKLNHVTREYTVTVASDNVAQDVKICLKGDVDGNGTVNVRDVNRTNLQAKGKLTLDTYEFACANVTTEATPTVNVRDVNKINLHAKGKASLW